MAFLTDILAVEEQLPNSFNAHIKKKEIYIGNVLVDLDLVLSKHFFLYFFDVDKNMQISIMNSHVEICPFNHPCKEAFL